MKRRALLAGASSVALTAFTQPFTINIITSSSGGAGVTGITLSGQAFSQGTASGTTVGTTTPTTTGSPGVINYTVDDTVNFQMSGSSGVLKTNGVLSGSSYPIHITATPTTGTPFTQAFTIVGVSLPAPGSLQVTVTIPDTYTRWGTTQQAAGVYVFNETAGTVLSPWVDPFGAFTMSRTSCRATGCLLRVYICRTNDSPAWYSVEFELGDVAGTGLGPMRALYANGTYPVVMNLSRYSVIISDSTGTLFSHTLGPNGPNSPNPPTACAHGYYSGWRWTSEQLSPTPIPWPHKRTIAFLQANGFLPLMTTSSSPGWSTSTPGPGPAAYPMLPALEPNWIVQYQPYGGGDTGTGDQVAGMMQGVAANYVLFEQTTDYNTLRAIGDGSHTFPLWLRDLRTEALADTFNTTNYVDPTLVPLAPFYGMIDVTLTNNTSASIQPVGGHIVDQGGTGLTYNWMTKAFLFDNPTYVVPAHGSLTVTINTFNGSSGDNARPFGTPVITGSSTDVSGLTCAWVQNSLVLGAHTSADPTHNLPHSYVIAVVTGDPYYLTGVHALGLNAISSTWNHCHKVVVNGQTVPDPTGFGFGPAGRSSAWGTRDLFQSWQATPSGAPSWITPKSSWASWVSAVMQGYNWWVVTPTATLISHFGLNPNDNTRTTFNYISGGFSTGQQVAGIWQNDYEHQAVSWADMFQPNTLWDGVVDFCVQNMIARLNGTSGWCQSKPVAYNFLYSPDGVNIAQSWAQLWSQSQPHFGWAVCTNTTNDSVFPNDAPNYDYSSGMWTAMSLALQAAGNRSSSPSWVSSLTTVRAALIASLTLRHGTDATVTWPRKQAYT